MTISRRGASARWPTALGPAKTISRRRRSVPGIGDRDAGQDGRGRTALVTGASSGIGWSMAELLAAKGYDVVPVARREQRLEDLREQLERRWRVRVHPLSCDLADPEASAHLREELDRRGLTVDVLVNNAGYALLGPYLQHEWRDHLRFVRVLGLNVAELCHTFLPHMVEQRWGRVINVASIAGIMSGSPGAVLYCATKSFVHKFTEGLAAEYEPYGIHCTVALVGPTDTEFGIGSGFASWMDSNLLVQLVMMRPEAVARTTYNACMRGRRVVVPGWHQQVWGYVLVHAPPRIRYGLSKFGAAVPVDAPMTPSGNADGGL